MHLKRVFRGVIERVTHTSRARNASRFTRVSSPELTLRKTS